MKNTANLVQLRELIRKLERKLGLLDEQVMSCCGVTMAQCHALVEVGRSKQMSLNELAEMLNLENSTMSRTVNNLVNSELVKRDIDPQDRRYVSISLTENGSKLFEGIEESRNQYYLSIFNAIPQEKREQVIESLELLLEALDSNSCCC